MAGVWCGQAGSKCLASARIALSWIITQCFAYPFRVQLACTIWRTSLAQPFQSLHAVLLVEFNPLSVICISFMSFGGPGWTVGQSYGRISYAKQGLRM